MGRPKEVTDEQIVNAARRCFLKHGTGVTAVHIGRELGVSHTTVFNRFGSKEALMIAALGPPSRMPWVAALDAGPDKRPMPEQLLEHARAMSAYFQELHTGFGVLQASGIDLGKATRHQFGAPSPERAFDALVAWLLRAQKQRRLARFNASALASTILASLQGWAFTARICGQSTSDESSKQFVESFVELLWNGIGTKHSERRSPAS